MGPNWHGMRPSPCGTPFGEGLWGVSFNLLLLVEHIVSHMRPHGCLVPNVTSMGAKHDPRDIIEYKACVR